MKINAKRIKQGEIKSLLIFSILLLGIFFLVNLNPVSAVGETIYCAEKTISGAQCQNVPFKEVDTDYRYDRTSCESTNYCSTGTCMNTKTGTCLPSPEATCNSEEGGFFYSQEKDEVAQCQVGCCLLGEGAAFVERVKCDTLGKDYNVKADFRPDIQDEITCLSLAYPKARGACVFETERGRECQTITNKECQDSSGEFHNGFLCTNPDLGTICAQTQRTTCVKGKNDVYFVDSCGNIANVYDANKVDDIPYWSFVPGIQEVEVDSGDGKGNVDSQIYGDCNYLFGSTCGIGNARYGDYICKDLKCTSGTLAKDFYKKRGRYPEHGESWCSQPIENFQNAKPGQISYLLYCYDGEIQNELCDHFRNKLCLEDRDAGNANCIANEWINCFFQENTDDCLNKGDCKIADNVGVLRTSYGTEKPLIDSDTGKEIKSSCVPKYTPGFKFWDPEGTILSTEETPESMCSIFSNVACAVQYTQEIIGVTDWRIDPSQGCVEQCKEEGGSAGKCTKACTPVCLKKLSSKDADAKINQEWAESWQSLCVSIGDCGVASNYLGRKGYNRWLDLFIGNKIDWETLPNANKRI